MNSIISTVIYNVMENEYKKAENENENNVNENNYITPIDLILNTDVSRKVITTNILILMNRLLLRPK
jgi:hypothetical protein